MSAALKPIALLGYEPPAVKAGEVVVPIRINGGLFELRGAPGVMRALAGDILAVLAPDARAGRVLNPNYRRRQKRATAARVEEYHAAWRRYISSPRLSIDTLAAELGLTQQSLSYWFRKFRREPGAPSLKPSGKL
jgi:hypothetical protein